MAETDTFTTTQLATADVTVVEVRSSKGVVATGSAKKHPKDEPNKVVGGKLALARALRLLADGFEAEAEDEMSKAQKVESPGLTIHVKADHDGQWTTLGGVVPGTITFTDDVDRFDMFRI